MKVKVAGLIAGAGSVTGADWDFWTAGVVR